MNLENIKIGEYKDYKDLCMKLNMTIEEGNSKVKQINELRRYCKLKHDRGKWGNKYFITNVYDVEKAELGIGLYKKDIELLVLDLLAQQEGEKHISLTIKSLLKRLEIVNVNYINGYGYKNFLKLSEFIKVDEDIIGDVFYLINNKATRNLKSALSDLKDKALILWEMSLNVSYRNEIIAYDENGNFILGYDGLPLIARAEIENRKATEKEKELILDAEYKTMQEMKVKSKIFFNINEDARGKFNEQCKEKLKEHNIRYYYYTYDITYNSNNILEELGRTERAEVRNRLNQKFLEQTEFSIENARKGIKEKLGDDAMDLLELELYSGNELRLTPRQQARVKVNYEKQAKKTAKTVIDRKIKGRNKIE